MNCMDLNMYIHGASKGQKIWSAAKNENDLPYINNFYIRSDDSPESKLIVEILNIEEEGKTFCYYSYLKYKDVVGADDRDGVYFGMTLRLDCYCVDFVSIYNILDTAYKKYIVGMLLVENNGIKKYTTTDFRSKDKELKDLMGNVISLIRLSLSSRDFIDLRNLKVTNADPLTVSLLDCTKENILSVISKCSKVDISPYYPTANERRIQKNRKEQMATYEKTKEKEIEDLRNSLQQQINRSTTERNSLQQKVDELTAAKEKLTASVSSLEKEKQSLQGRLRASEERKNASELVVSLREPLTKLAKIVGTSEEHDHSHRYENSEHEYDNHESKTSKLKDFFFPILHTVLLVIIVVYCSFRTYSEVVNKEPKAVETEIQRTSADNEESVDTMIVSPMMNMHEAGMSNQ